MQAVALIDHENDVYGVSFPDFPGCTTTAGDLDAAAARAAEVLAFHVEGLADQETGWLAGLKDPFVSRALSLLHARVAQEWTVEDLGREVGLSRSALAERFTRLIGEPPMRYLARWRIQLAAHQLRTSDSSLARIAEQVGYESEAAFSRAFRRSYGAPPATWRKDAAPAVASLPETG